MLLIELIALLKRIYSESKDTTVSQLFVEEKIYEPLQLLLSNQDDTLLKCILELLQ